jgi:hypothetical protein
MGKNNSIYGVYKNEKNINEAWFSIILNTEL